MQIKLNLVLSLILEAVKADTHIKGGIDRSKTDAALQLAYLEEAGDEEIHERKLMRNIYTSVDSLKSELSAYVLNSGLSASTGDNIYSSIDEASDSIIIRMEVSDNFNTGYTDSIARLCSKYIEDNTLVMWWQTIDANQMQIYTNALNNDILALKKSFVKMPLKPVIPPYTKSITTVGTTIDATVRQEFTITYSIDEGAVDDVELFTPYGVDFRRGEDGIFYAITHFEGIFRCKLYSVHDEDVNTTITVRSTNE